VLYKSNGKILFQDRRDMSKDGEEYGFFGGWVDERENFEEACVRETKEELNIDLALSDISLASSFSKTVTWLGTSENYIEYDDIIQILEWKAWIWWTLSEAKQQIFFNHDYMVFALLELYFDKNTGLYLWIQDILDMQKSFHGSFESLEWKIIDSHEEKPGIIKVDFEFIWVKSWEEIRFQGVEYIIVANCKIQHIEIKNK